MVDPFHHTTVHRAADAREVDGREVDDQFAQSDATSPGADRHAEAGGQQLYREHLVDASQPPGADLGIADRVRELIGTGGLPAGARLPADDRGADVHETGTATGEPSQPGRQVPPTVGCAPGESSARHERLIPM